MTDVTPSDTGLCAPWTTRERIQAFPGVPSIGSGTPALTTDDLDWAAMEASELLYEMSGHRYPGSCVQTDRPGGDATWFAGIERARWHGDRWDFAEMYDSRLSNPLVGWWSECLSEVPLRGMPVTAVTSVKVDGVVLTDSSWQLLDGHRLIRTDGARWPAWQNLGRSDDEEGTFSITYQYGQGPPRTGIDAASALGAELVKANRGLDCKLPVGVTSIQRQGITITRQALQDLKANGWGIPLVDAFIEVYGLKAPGAAVWTPDIGGISPNIGGLA